MFKTNTYTDSITLVTIECYKCHVIFAIPDNLRKRALENSSISFYCPNGHSQSYVDTEVDKLKSQLANKEYEIAQSNSARDTWMHSAQKYKGELEQSEKGVARLKRRVANGVCPCCKRTFKQLSKHMEGQHPDYVAETKLVVPAK